MRNHNVKIPASTHVEVVVKVAVCPSVMVSVSVAVERTTIVAVVTGPGAVTVAPGPSIVHWVGKPDGPSVIVGMPPSEVLGLFRPDSGSS